MTMSGLRFDISINGLGGGVFSGDGVLGRFGEGVGAVAGLWLLNLSEWKGVKKFNM